MLLIFEIIICDNLIRSECSNNKNDTQNDLNQLTHNQSAWATYLINSGHAENLGQEAQEIIQAQSFSPTYNYTIEHNNNTINDIEQIQTNLNSGEHSPGSQIITNSNLISSSLPSHVEEEKMQEDLQNVKATTQDIAIQTAHYSSYAPTLDGFLDS